MTVRTDTNTYIIYKHECTLCKGSNGIYIGLTSMDLNKRWCNGYGYLSKDINGNYHQPKIARAILKYGWENFTHEVLFENLTEAEAKQKEKQLIAYYNSYEQGLNCTLGGEGTSKFASAEEREQHTKEWWANWRETNRNKMRAYHKQYKLENASAIARLNKDYRAKHKEETKKYKADYYQKNKEKLRTNVANYRELNKEKVAAWNKQYHLSHQEECNKRSALYRQTHKEELAEKSRVKRAEKMQLLEQLRGLNIQYPGVLTREESESLRTKDTCGGLKKLNQLLSKFNLCIKEELLNETNY